MTTQRVAQMALSNLVGRSRESGMTLVELSIVLIVVGILLGSSFQPIARLKEQRLHSSAEDQLNQVRDRLVGHVMSYGFLPCPLSLETKPDPHIAGENCQYYRGAISASLMGGLGTSDSAGRLLDPWNRPIRYALSDSDHESRGQRGLIDWSSESEIRHVGVSNLVGNLSVCSEALRVCREPTKEDARAVFVLLSTGANAGGGGLQWANLNADSLFQKAPFSINNQFEYDDHVVWVSRSELVYWLVRSGQLP